MKKFTFRTTIHCTLDIPVIAETYEEATDKLNDKVHNLHSSYLEGTMSGYDEDMIAEEETEDIKALMVQAEGIMQAAEKHAIAFFLNGSYSVTIERTSGNGSTTDTITTDLTGGVMWSDFSGDLAFDTAHGATAYGSELEASTLLAIYHDIINSAEENGINPQTFELL